MSLFVHELPVEASRPSTSEAGRFAATKKPPPKGKPDPTKGGTKGGTKGDKPGKGDKGGPVHTQMKGEKPGDDLGYDPKIIPVEEIE